LIEDTLNNFNTIVFLKIFKIFRQLFEVLTDLNMLGKCVYVKRCSMQDQEIITDMRKINDANADYFSILIFRR